MLNYLSLSLCLSLSLLCSRPPATYVRLPFHQAWVDENYVNLALEAMYLGSLFDMIYAKGNRCFSRPPGVVRCRNQSAGGGSQRHGQRDERAVLAMAFQILWGLK